MHLFFTSYQMLYVSKPSAHEFSNSLIFFHQLHAVVTRKRQSIDICKKNITSIIKINVQTINF